MRPERLRDAWECRAMLFASVPVAVKTISSGAQRASAATAARASSSIRRARVPAPCGEEGLPNSSSAASSARRAAAHTGVVAALSK